MYKNPSDFEAKPKSTKHTNLYAVVLERCRRVFVRGTGRLEQLANLRRVRSDPHVDEAGPVRRTNNRIWKEGKEANKLVFTI